MHPETLYLDFTSLQHVQHLNTDLWSMASEQATSRRLQTYAAQGARCLLKALHMVNAITACTERSARRNSLGVYVDR